jgi:hypothetical protein
VLLARPARARVVTADLGCRADVLRDRRSVMVVPVIAIGAVHMTWRAVIMVVMIMVTIGAMHVRGGGFECLGHRGACGGGLIVASPT